MDKVSCDWRRAEQSSPLIGPVPRLRVAGDLGLQAGQEDNRHREEREECGDLHQGDGGALHQLQVREFCSTIAAPSINNHHFN